MMFAFRKQPFKAAYIIYTLLIVIVKLPYWTLISLVPSWRPRPSWTLARSVILSVLQTFLGMIYATGFFISDNSEKSAKSANKLGFVWVDPLPADFLTGEMASMAALNETVSTRIHGYWYGKDVGSGDHGGKAQPDEKVLYHLHGGAYIMGSANPASSLGRVTADYVKECAQVTHRAFCLDYRLSSAAPFEPANPFPAALIDALAGYRYLVETLGFKANNIIVSGDSAGGHLALTLVRYLTQAAIPSLPAPGALVLLSPASDLGDTHDGGPDSSMIRNVRSDIIQVVHKSKYTARALCGVLPADSTITNAWISPASLRVDTRGLFANFPPTMIVSGGAEQILDSIRTLYEKLRADNDDDRIHYVEYPDATHDFIMAVYHDPEKTDGARDVARWLGMLYAEPLVGL